MATLSDLELAFFRAALGVATGTLGDTEVAYYTQGVAQGTFDPNALSVGQETLDRRICNTSNTLTSGTIRLTYFTSRKTETVNNVRMTTGGTASATPTLVRIGIYSVDSSGNLTLIGSTASDTALFSVINTQYTKTLSAPVNLVAGQRYALAAIFVGTTAPTVAGVSTLAPEDFIAPRLAGSFAGQTDLVGSIPVGSVVASGNLLFAAITP